MGNLAGYRAAFIAAERYRRKLGRVESEARTGAPPARDLALETLVEVMRGKIWSRSTATGPTTCAQ